MLGTKPVLGFLARFVLVYGTLIAPWPGLNEAFARIYCEWNNMAFGSVLPNSSLRFEPIASPVDKLDVVLEVTNWRTPHMVLVPLSSRSPTYVQIAFLIALILSTPMIPRRKLPALLAGLLLMLLAVSVRQIIILRHAFDRTFAFFPDASMPTGTVSGTIRGMLTDDVVLHVMLPVLIWALLCLIATDWRSWLGHLSQRLPRPSGSRKRLRNARPHGLRKSAG